MYESFAYSVYFAPRGKKRLMKLGNNLAMRYLIPGDRLIGLIGDAGAGKSLLIRGMFPGLILTNDDQGINIRPLPVLDHWNNGNFKDHTYHVDARFETAFAQPWEIVRAIEAAVDDGKRVVVEHFDLIAPQLKINAEVLIGIGEEVLVTRPGVFGPNPQEIVEIVFKSIQYRRMAHTAEDLTAKVIEGMGYPRPPLHSDVKNGFVLEFTEKPDFSPEAVESKVKELIERNIPVSFQDEEHILLGGEPYFCTGPRIHVKRTGEIKGFRLLKEFKFEPKSGLYLLAGLVGTPRSQFRFNEI